MSPPEAYEPEDVPVAESVPSNVTHTPISANSLEAGSTADVSSEVESSSHPEPSLSPNILRKANEFNALVDGFTRNSSLEKMLRSLAISGELGKVKEAWDQVFSTKKHPTFDSRVFAELGNAADIKLLLSGDIPRQERYRDAGTPRSAEEIERIASHLRTDLEQWSARYAPESEKAAAQKISEARANGYLQQLDSAFTTETGRSISWYVRSKVLNDKLVQAYFGREIASDLKEFSQIKEHWFKADSTRQFLARIITEGRFYEVNDAWNSMRDTQKYPGLSFARIAVSRTGTDDPITGYLLDRLKLKANES